MTAIPNEELDMLTLIEQAVCAGARAIEEAAQGEIQIHRKDDHSIVMSLDLAAQDAIKEVLKGSLPVVSEEDPGSHDLIIGGGDLFVVDPLDGTSSCSRALKNHGKFVPTESGYGPMVGLVRGGTIKAVAFLNIASRTLFSAMQGRGAFATEMKIFDGHASEHVRTRLSAPKPPPLKEAYLVFYPGTQGELPLVKYLKERERIDGLYRFGGFANDCTRVARGYEQILVQFSLRPWDLPAALVAQEAGLIVTLDPFKSKVGLHDWVLKSINPVLISPPEYRTELAAELAAYQESVRQ